MSPNQVPGWEVWSPIRAVCFCTYFSPLMQWSEGFVEQTMSDSTMSSLNLFASFPHVLENVLWKHVAFTHLSHSVIYVFLFFSLFLPFVSVVATPSPFSGVYECMLWGWWRLTLENLEMNTVKVSHSIIASNLDASFFSTCLFLFPLSRVKPPSLFFPLSLHFVRPLFYHLNSLTLLPQNDLYSQ